MKKPNKSIKLPKTIADYFVADKKSSDEVSRTFTEAAVVTDEGRTFSGRAAIKKWKENASTKYEYASEPLDCEQKGGQIIVTSRLTGNFPGSPVDLRYLFELEGDKIASLKIIP